LGHASPIANETPSAGPIIFDLGDFVPEEYLIRFSIDGHSYEVRYQEARVDEVLALLSEAASQKPPKELADSRRRYVTELFSQNLTVGDKDQLAADLKLVPYSSLRGELDIYALYVHTQSRVKKTL
jgi:hypothetical protein